MNQLEMSEQIEVPIVLNDTQVRSFVENGYLAVPGLVTDDEVEEIRADLLKLARGGYPCKSLEPLPPDISDEEALFRILCIHQPHHISPVMRKYVLHPKICGALSQITAAHLPYWDGSVKCVQSMAFVKPPGFQGQAWHQDEGYIPTRDRSIIGAWIALDDATIENGCLRVIPGSHQTGYLWPQRGHENDDEFDFAGECHGFDESTEVPVEVKTGTLIFFNGYLLHRSFKNRSDCPRRVLVNHYCNAWSLVPWSVHEGEAPAHADRRGILPVAGVDPYKWKGYDKLGDNVSLRTCKAVRKATERVT